MDNGRRLVSPNPASTHPNAQLRFFRPMNARPLLVALSFCVIGFAASAAEEAPKKQATKEEIQARLAEHARRKSAPTPEPAPPKSAPPVTPAEKAAPAASTAATKAPPASPATPAPAQEPAAVLPRVDVRKDRVTELDRQLEKQNQEIAREKKNTKPTPLDETLNGPKVSKIFGIFGGQSSDDRSNIAKERVSMMEEEREMLEAISQATSQEEKRELQKTLDSMKAMRRELERALR